MQQNDAKTGPTWDIDDIPFSDVTSKQHSIIHTAPHSEWNSTEHNGTTWSSNMTYDATWNSTVDATKSTRAFDATRIFQNASKLLVGYTKLTAHQLTATEIETSPFTEDLTNATHRTFYGNISVHLFTNNTYAESYIESTTLSSDLLSGSSIGLPPATRLSLTDHTTTSSPIPSNSTEGRIQWAYIGLGLIPLWILFGNLLVLLAVLSFRHLRTLSNWVIASLAFTDFLLALIVVPLGIYQLVNGRWELGLSVCLVWTGSDVFLSTTSIMHLCCIAIHRYLGIANPLRIRSTQNKRHVIAMLLPAWTLSLAISMPLIVQGALDPKHVFVVDETDGNVFCGIFDHTFAIYSSLVSYFIPLAIMVFADLRSVQILRRTIKIPEHQNGQSGGAGGGGSVGAGGGGGGGETAARVRTQSSVESSLYELSPTESYATQHTLTSYTSRRVSTGENRTLSARSTSADNLRYHSTNPNNTHTCGRPTLSNDYRLLGRGVRSPGRDYRLCTSFMQPDYISTTAYEDERISPTSHSDGAMTSLHRRGSSARRRSRATSMGYISILTARGMIKINSRERRAEKTLIWVFVCFVVFWLPFFCTNLTYGICRHGCDIPDNLFLSFTWLGYISSGVNPCLYTFLNRDFRIAFKNIITCRIRSRRLPKR